MNKLNILYDGRTLFWGLNNGMRNGIFFVAKNILNNLLQRNDINIWIYFPKNLYNEKDKILNQFNLTSDIAKTDTDNFSNINAYFSPLEAKPDFLVNYPKISCYTILHDIIPSLFPEYYQNCDNTWYNSLLVSLSFNDYYFSNSNHTANDFLKYFPQINPNNILTIPLSTNLKYKQNKDVELLKKVPHIDFLDLAIVCMINIPFSEENGEGRGRLENS